MLAVKLSGPFCLLSYNFFLCTLIKLNQCFICKSLYVYTELLEAWECHFALCALLLSVFHFSVFLELLTHSEEY